MPHRTYVGIGSNLGDRRANILTALQRLRSFARVDKVSAFYESAAAEGAEGPAFLNVAAALEVDADRATFERRLSEIQRAVGRTSTQRLAARPIDIDLLAFDTWEHPQLSQRPYNLIPLAEIAPGYAARARSKDGAAMRRLEHGLRFQTDRQQEIPAIRIGIGRAGVLRVRRMLNLDIDGRTHTVRAELSMVADLAPNRAGVHMSRFVESLEEAVLEVLDREAAPRRIDALVEAIARDIVATQEAGSADVRLRADFALERWTPVSGRRGEEPYTLIGISHADENGARSVTGVEAEGITACPCAQDMVREHSLLELREAGFSDDEAQRVLTALPGATHNQRGCGCVLVGIAGAHRPAPARVEDLVEIAESSMSSETYDLLKRPDEFFVVNKAHRNPRFVEDVVRGIVARTLETYSSLDDSSFVFASQRNEESIHKHDAFAEAYGTFGEFRRELRDGAATERTGLAAWLGTPARRFAISATDEN
jgi:GTP cyclohydrolase-4